MARTWTASLPWMIQTLFCPWEILPISQEKNFGILREIFLFYRENVCCVYSLESPH